MYLEYLDTVKSFVLYEPWAVHNCHHVLALINLQKHPTVSPIHCLPLHVATGPLPPPYPPLSSAALRRVPPITSSGPPRSRSRIGLSDVVSIDTGASGLIWSP